MRPRLLLPYAFIALASFAHADETWLGVYMNGAKIGYSFSSTSDAMLDGRKVKKIDSLSVLGGNMLGSQFSMRMESQSWVDAKGKALRMRFVNSSAGRRQVVEADFGSTQIDARVDNNGAKTTKKIEIPAGAVIVDDATYAVLSMRAGGVGSQKELYVFDPVTVSLVKNRVLYQGRQKVRVGKSEFTSDRIDVIDPRATSKVFLSAKGDLVKVEGPLGLEMLPQPKAQAMNMDASDSKGVPDLAFDTMIRLPKPIERIDEASSVGYTVRGIDLSRMPSDAHQTVTKDVQRWSVVVHPVALGKGAATIEQAAGQKPEWIKPDLHIPSDQPRFVELAKEVVGESKTVEEAAGKVRAYVHGLLRGNVSIAVLRDASEILESKEGLCRDHAILCATLLRAARVPARLVSGLVYEAGALYYHAWTEVWNGTDWVGVDSTRDADQVSAGHLKIAQGTLADAFTFFVLDGAKVEAAEVRYRQ